MSDDRAARRVGNALTLGIITRSEGDGIHAHGALSGRDGEAGQAVEILMPYGVTYRVRPVSPSGAGAETLVAEVEGDRRIALPPTDPRHRVRAAVMAAGDLAYNSDLDTPNLPAGQAAHRLTFGRDGDDPVVWVDVAGRTTTEQVRIKINGKTGAAEIVASGTVTATVGGDLSCSVAGTARIAAPQIVLDSDVSITGNLAVGASITVAADVTAGGSITDGDGDGGA